MYIQDIRNTYNILSRRPVREGPMCAIGIILKKKVLNRISQKRVEVAEWIQLTKNRHQ
jgi:hypothetical protein